MFFLHEQHTLRRDIKPQSMLFHEESGLTLKLSDLGSAAQARSVQVSFSRSGVASVQCCVRGQTLCHMQVMVEDVPNWRSHAFLKQGEISTTYLHAAPEVLPVVHGHTLPRNDLCLCVSVLPACRCCLQVAGRPRVLLHESHLVCSSCLL